MLTVLLGAAAFVIQWNTEEMNLRVEKSTGLGAVAPGFLHDFVSPPKQIAPRARPAAPRQFVPPIAEDLSFSLPGPVPGGSMGGVIGGVIGAMPAAAPPPPPPRPQFKPTIAQRFSTFSIDVDTASYTLVRKWLLTERTLPPPGLVRVEEMLNFFTYQYPNPAAAHPVSVTSEVAACPWNPQRRLLRVGLKSKPVELGSLPPAHLTFLVDVSGSMQAPDKLPLVKRSLGLLTEQLRAEDTVAAVVYAGAAGLVLPPTSGANRRAILDAIDRLEAGGSTAGGEGLRLAYATAHTMFRQGANNRVILATDGDFNVGVSSDDELIRLVESERNRGIFLTVLGYGMGNLQDGKLEKIADHGNGHYAYVDSILEARRVLVEEVGATLQTVAKDVKVQLEFDPAQVASYRLVGYDNRRLTEEEFRDDRKDAGDLGAGHAVTALYEIVPAVTTTPLTAATFTVRVRYKQPESEQSVEATWPGTAETATPSTDFRFAAAVAEFGLALAGSEGASLASALSQAAAAAAGDQRREEFVALARRAAEVSSLSAAARPQ